MDETIFVDPPRTSGYVIQGFSIVVLAALVVTLFNQALQAELGPRFLIFLLGGLTLALPLPVLLYRIYALNRSNYVLRREGVELRWGLREEHIPMTDIDWVRLDRTLDEPLTLPPIRWPGGVLGVQRQKDGSEVEFLAARSNLLVLIGTKNGTFAISPQDHKAFLRAFRSRIELGGLKPIAARSLRPSFLLGEVWKSRPTRILLLAGAALNLALLIWVGVAAPERETVLLGNSPNVTPVPGVQLFLLPIVSMFFFLANFVAAVYFYRRDEKHPLAYFMWAVSVVTALLFLGAVAYILGVG